MKSKKISALLIAGLLTFSSSLTVFANAPITIAPFSTSYVYSSYEVKNVASFSTSITLSSVDKYGKVFFSNKSNSDVTLIVDGVETKTISPNTSGSIIWTKSLLTSTYKIEVRGPKVGVMGLLSVAKSDIAF